MPTPIRILLQTTIPHTEDDWHIGRFSILQAFLRGLKDVDGAPLCDVTARDRGPVKASDPVLARLDSTAFDQLWLFAVDTGDGLDAEDCRGIERFRERGGGVLVARDHMDLGCSVCGLSVLGSANFFHTRHLLPDIAARRRDDDQTPSISWPNFHSGANGDFQEICAQEPVHPILIDTDSPTGAVRFLPSHPHEGAVGAPPGEPSARVIATGTSKITGTRFNIAVAFEASPAAGAAVTQSTFHHFVDLNWDTAAGSPSFVTEPPGGALAGSSVAQASIRRYVVNLVCWLSGRDPDSVRDWKDDTASLRAGPNVE